MQNNDNLMKIFTSPFELCSMLVYKHSKSQETYQVLYLRRQFTIPTGAIYEKGSMFVGIGTIEHRFCTHLLIAPDGKICIGTQACDLEEIP